jgi:hypothetical protein
VVLVGVVAAGHMCVAGGAQQFSLFITPKGIPVNIDFANHVGFSSYVVLLLVSCIILFGLDTAGSRWQAIGWRIFNILVGVAFFGYGIYLGFCYADGMYLILFKVFVLPVVLIIRFFRSRRSQDQITAPTNQ